MSYLLPDDAVPGAFRVVFGRAQQSWVDPARPDFLVFEYVQQIAVLLEHTVLRRPEAERLRVVHLGGGGLSVPRWIEWRRPETAQIVCEPCAELTEEVRRKAPLQKRSGIKVREVDGRTGLLAMRDDWADCLIVDAFDGARVPGELVTREALGEIRRILRGEAVCIINVTDQAPFVWTKRVVAGLRHRWRHVFVGAEPAVFKGRRFGNLLLIGAMTRPDEQGIIRASAGLPAGYRWISGADVEGWVSNALPFTDAAAESSPEPSSSMLWY